MFEEDNVPVVAFMDISKISTKSSASTISQLLPESQFNN